MGTASFAVPTLDILLNNGFDLVAVVTAPDRPAGRGKKIRFSPVKEYALQHNLKLLQPEKLKEASFVQELKNLKPDIQVVVAFRMLPEAVWKIPPMGTLNLHASLLPQFRGAAPINHAIIRGKSMTGLTTFFIDKEIDTGRILKQTKVPIAPAETAGELHDRMMAIGARLTLETVRELLEGTIKPVSQEDLIADDEAIETAPKIYKEDCRIDWNLDIDQVHDLIRGLSPLPGAFTMLALSDGTTKTLKVYGSKKIPGAITTSPGSFRIDKNSFAVACKNGYIELTEIQLEGKRKMQVFEFLRGFNTESVLELR